MTSKPPPAPTISTTSVLELPERIWVVVRTNGEFYFVHKEPLEGMAEWAKGTDATVAEYRLVAVVHTPTPKKKKEK